MSLENDLVAIAKAGEWAVVCFDRPGTLARRMAGKLWARGLEARAEFEWALSKDGNWMSWPFFVPLSSAEPLALDVETSLAVEELAQGFYAKKGIKVTDEKVAYTRKWIVNSIRVWGTNSPLPHLSWLERCLHPGNRHREAAKARDERVVRFLTEHPATARMLTDFGFFPTIFIAGRRLQKLTKRRIVHRFRSLYEEDGVYHRVYFCGPMFGENVVQHHTELTRLLLAFRAERIVRWGVEHDADAQVVLGEISPFIEHDRDTENDKTVRQRAQQYAGYDVVILWVAPTIRRLKELLRLTTVVADRSMYTTYTEVLKPHEPVWRLADGTVIELPRAAGLAS